MDLEAAIELPELQSRFAPDTQVAIAARAEAETGLIQLQEEGWTGFSEGWQGCSEGFPKGKARGHLEEQPCQPNENLVHLDSFTGIYILFKIGYFADFSVFFKYGCMKKHTFC